MQEFKVGDFVKFLNDRFSEYVDCIEPQYVYHGDCVLRKPEYDERGCEIIAKSNGYWVVKAPTNTTEDRKKDDPCSKIGRMKGYTQLGFRGNNLVLFKSTNNKNMASNLIEKFKIALMGEPEKSFITKGITDISGNLTPDGEELYRMWQFEKDKKAFNDEVVSKIEVDEKK